MPYIFSPIWTDETFEGEVSEFKQFIEQQLPVIEEWARTGLNTHDIRHSQKVFRQCRRLNQVIEDCHSRLVVMQGVAKIYFKHDTDDHVITSIAFAEELPRKCELCNGPLSPKGRAHNCPGDVI